MFNYNSKHTFIGYIKQLLSSFNYPKVDIYNDNIIPIEGNYYIKNNGIYKYNQGELKKIFVYNSNKYIANITENFKNNSTLYDTNTHLFLGNYLRFLRDYNNLNLMSLYNCFTNDLANDLYIMDGEFDSNDNSYKIYEIPIKLFQTYSIYVACSGKVEIVCAFKNNNDTINNIIQKYTYTHKGGTTFKTPLIFNKLSKELLSNVSLSTLEDYYNNKNDLKLYLKLPASNKSSIVILEGVFNNYNDSIILEKSGRLAYNTSYTNYKVTEDSETEEEKLVDNENVDKIPLISPLELLYINSGTSHPFADRLVEYLTSNVITPRDEVVDNIKRVQKSLVERYNEYKTTKNEKGGEEKVKDSNGNYIHLKLGMSSYGDSYGIWIPKMKNIFYDILAVNGQIGLVKDTLGYCDKDVESKLGKDVDIYSRIDGGYDL